MQESSCIGGCPDSLCLVVRHRDRHASRDRPPGSRRHRRSCRCKEPPTFHDAHDPQLPAHGGPRDRRACRQPGRSRDRLGDGTSEAQLVRVRLAAGTVGKEPDMAGRSVQSRWPRPRKGASKAPRPKKLRAASRQVANGPLSRSADRAPLPLAEAPVSIGASGVLFASGDPSLLRELATTCRGKAGHY